MHSELHNFERNAQESSQIHTQGAFWTHIQRFGTLANVIGGIGSLLTLCCLFFLPSPLNLLVPLYAAIGIWVFIRPEAALYMLPIAVPWGSLEGLLPASLNVSGADLLVFLLGASWALQHVLRTKGKTEISTGPVGFPFPRVLLLTLLGLLFAMLLSIPGAQDLKLCLKEIIKWVEVLLICLIGTTYLRTRRQIWILTAIACLAAISQAGLGFFQYAFQLGPTSFIRGDSLRIYGSFSQPNPYAGYLNMTLVLSLALLLLGNSLKVRVPAGIVSLILGIAVYLTDSRGGMLALAAGIGLLILLGLPKKWNILIRLALIGALAGVAAYFAGLIPQHLLLPLFNKLGLTGISLVAPQDADFATAERLAHWIAGINMFLDHPLTGVGIGNYPAVYDRYFITIFNNPLGHAHNYYINIAAEAGILGLGALLLFLTTIFLTGGYILRNTQRAIDNSKKRFASAQGASFASKLLAQTSILANDRALVVGLLASQMTVCVHNLVDNLYVHSMTSLIALYLIMLLRLGHNVAHEQSEAVSG